MLKDKMKKLIVSVTYLKTVSDVISLFKFWVIFFTFNFYSRNHEIKKSEIPQQHYTKNVLIFLKIKKITVIILSLSSIFLFCRLRLLESKRWWLDQFWYKSCDMKLPLIKEIVNRNRTALCNVENFITKPPDVIGRVLVRTVLSLPHLGSLMHHIIWT